MLRDLPEWRVVTEFRGPDFTFSRPAFLRPHELGPVWSFTGAAGGDLTVCLEPEPGELAAFLDERLTNIADEVRRDGAGTEVLSRGPGEVSGPDLAGHLIATYDGGSERIDVCLYRDPRSPRIAVLTFRLPEPDPVLRSRLVPVVLESFRFR